MALEGLLDGPHSVRLRTERGSLWLSILSAPLVIGLVGIFFHGITISEVVLLVVVGLVFVSLARGRLVGSGIRVSERQFPELFAMVEELALQLGVETPHVFVRDDPVVPIVTVGIETPYALIVSSQYLEHLRPPELRFLFARELAHIAAGHTRIASLFSASGRENPFVALLFGAWLRKTEYTADRAGLLFCETIDDAIGAIAVTTFHAVGHRIDYEVLAEQHRELEDDGRLRLGEWTSGSPFATNRIEALRGFDQGPLAAYWRDELARTKLSQRSDDPGAAELPIRVRRRDTAPQLRRVVALAIDLTVVMAILQSGVALEVNKVVARPSDPEVAALLDTIRKYAPWLHATSVSFNPDGIGVFLCFFVYSAILVGIGGQTLGMMVTELRVVTTRFGRPSAAQVVWRYVVGLASLTFVLPATLGLFFRIQPHDRLSATRVIRGRIAP